MSNQTSVVNLLNGIEFDDPRLATLLQQLVADFYKLQNQVNPPTSATVFGLTGQIISPDSVSNFVGTLYANNLKLTWDKVDGVSYEIRYTSNGSIVWDTASVILKTSTTSADINPLTIPLIYGTYTFLIKTVASDGTYSTSPSIVIVTIPQIAAPTLTASTIGNFVLLYWTAPTSVFAIDHYNVYKNSVLQGNSNGTFESIFEIAAGTFIYIVEAVDIVGNRSTQSAGIVLTLGNPVDYILQASLNTDSFKGTKINCYAFNQ